MILNSKKVMFDRFKQLSGIRKENLDISELIEEIVLTQIGEIGEELNVSDHEAFYQIKKGLNRVLDLIDKQEAHDYLENSRENLLNDFEVNYIRCGKEFDKLASCPEEDIMYSLRKFCASLEAESLSGAPHPSLSEKLFNGYEGWHKAEYKEIIEYLFTSFEIGAHLCSSLGEAVNKVDKLIESYSYFIDFDLPEINKICLLG